MLWVPFTGVLEAQMVLRWKLKAGESFGVVVHQQTESQVAFSAKLATTKIDLKLHLEWTVTGADEKEIVLKQSVERIVMNLATPQGPAIDFDSAAKTRLSGQARELALALQPLVGAEFEITMNARGEMSASKPVNEAAKSLFSSDDKVADSGAAQRGTVQQLLRQSLVVLPEKEVHVGDTWTTSSELTTPAGLLTQETVYQLAENVEQEGKSLSQIATTSKLSPRRAVEASEPSGSKIKIKTHEQTGVILFSADEGRVVEAEQTQKLVTERDYRDTMIVVTLNSMQKTTVKPRP